MQIVCPVYTTVLPFLSIRWHGERADEIRENRSAIRMKINLDFFLCVWHIVSSFLPVWMRGWTFPATLRRRRREEWEEERNRSPLLLSSFPDKGMATACCTRPSDCSPPKTRQVHRTTGWVSKNSISLISTSLWSWYISRYEVSWLLESGSGMYGGLFCCFSSLVVAPFDWYRYRRIGCCCQRQPNTLQERYKWKIDYALQPWIKDDSLLNPDCWMIRRAAKIAILGAGRFSRQSLIKVKRFAERIK